MKKTGILLVVLLLTGLFKEVRCQSYHVEVWLREVTSTGTFSPYVGNISTSMSGVSQFNSGGLYPVKIFDHIYSEIDAPSGLMNIHVDIAYSEDPTGGIFLCPNGGVFDRYQEIDLRSSTACELQYYVQGISCSSSTGGGSISVEFFFEAKWTPVYTVSLPSPIPPSSITKTNYCENELITLNATPGYDYYIWEFQDENDPSDEWSPFAMPTLPHSQVTVGLNNLYGNGDHSSEYGVGIRFGVRMGSCSRAVTHTPIEFQPVSPKVSDADDVPVDPACHDGTGSYTIHSFNRLTRPGETYKVMIEDIHDDSNNEVLDDITSSSLPVTVNLLSGDYRVLVQSFMTGQQTTTSCGAAEYVYFTIANPDSVRFSVTSTKSPSCHDSTVGVNNDGEIRISASGGTGNGFSYMLAEPSPIVSESYQSMGSSAFMISALVAGDYHIKVRDANDCESSVVSGSVLPGPNVSISGLGVDASCFGKPDGVITATASGGTAPLEYSHNGTNFGTSPVFTGLGSGSYTITVRDGNNCTKASIPVPISAPLPITAAQTTQGSSCYNENDGAITVSSVSGGTSPYSIAIPGTINYNSFTTYNAPTSYSNLLGGTYTVNVKDANDCEATFTADIPRPDPISITTTQTIVTCFGGVGGVSDGTITINATNTQGSVQYSLDGTNFRSTNVFNGLSSNAYTVTVKDGNNCTNTASVTVGTNPVITGTLTTSNPISCNGSSDGSLSVTPGGGVGPYTYSWNNEATTNTLPNIPAGTYTVTIKDSKNCTKDFTRTLTEPAPIGVTYGLSNYTDFNIRCNGESNGSINLIASGGNGGYGYSWNTGATSQNLMNIPAGTYNVTVRDSKNCTGTQSITLIQPPQLSNTLTTENVLCFGDNSGRISFATTGGTGIDTYQYSITNGTNWSPTPDFEDLTIGTYALQVRDENGCSLTASRTLTSPPEIQLSISNLVNTTCNQSNGSAQVASTGGQGTHSYAWQNSSNQTIATVPNATNLAAGVYAIRVTDQNACQKQQNITISSSNGPQVTTTTITPTTCHDTDDGAVTINITQGQAPYTINWPNGQTTTTAQDLIGGEYIVEVRDQTNCLALHTVTIPSPTAITITTTEKTDPNCAGNADGTITTITTGGNGTYSYTWNTGATLPALTNIPAGTYTLEVKDIKDCTQQEQIILTDPPVFTVDLGPDQKICDGMTITKVSTEDNATYQWTSTNGYTSDQQQVNLTEPGVYTLTVTTQKGCTANDSFELMIDPDLLKADFLMVNEAHVGDTVVMIDISWPMPELVNWTFAAQATIIDQTPDYSLVRYEEPGAYVTRLTATLAQCISNYEQWITILEAEETDNEQAKTGKDFIKTFTVYPNPTKGVLSVRVELQEQELLTLEVYQAQSNQKVYGKAISATTEHSEAIDLSKLPGGVYVVRIKAGKETKSVKLIKVY